MPAGHPGPAGGIRFRASGLNGAKAVRKGQPELGACPKGPTAGFRSPLKSLYATGRILLAKSPEHNLCGKIYSHHGAKLDENRTYTLTNSTIMHSVGSVCRLVVTSPTVSGRFRTGAAAPPSGVASAHRSSGTCGMSSVRTV